MICFHGSGELVTQFASDGACADKLLEHFSKFFNTLQTQKREDFFDIGRNFLLADFDVGGEEVAYGGAVRRALAHAVRYGSACHGDGHTCDCGGVHQFFV